MMTTQRSQLNDLLSDDSTDIVTWGPKYATGIELIDQQHKELISLTNELFHACLSGRESSADVFKESLSRMVAYVRFHFGAEQALLQAVGYPHWAEHKKMHDRLIKSILDAAKDYNEGKKFVPNQFVRTLKDWIFGHIGINDKVYVPYVMEQKKKELLAGETGAD